MVCLNLSNMFIYTINFLSASFITIHAVLVFEQN